MSLFLKKLYSFLLIAKLLLFSKQALVIGALMLVSAYFNAVFVTQPLNGQRWLFKIYNPPLQKTLQKVEGHLISYQQKIRVLKVKRENKIYLEFLAKQADDSFLHINSVLLNGQREAYFDYWGEMTSLQILDDDGDGRLDVIAPTFDQLLRPKINLVVYNEQTKKFELKSNNRFPQVVLPQTRTKH